MVMMNWNAEANAKLFLAVLEQIKTQSVKLDYKSLADFMGPPCNPKSIQNQFTKLKKMAAEEGASSAPAAEGDAAGAGDGTATTAGKKRKGAPKSGGPAKKAKPAKAKGKGKAMKDESEEETGSDGDEHGEGSAGDMEE